jgi:peptidyl-prolyl cis-trans isomerase D
MFESVRRHRRLFLGIVLLLIIPSFVIVGAWDLIAPSGDAGTVAKVGREKIQYAQWERAHQQSLDQLRQQLGGRVDPSFLDTPASRRSTLDDLVNRQVLFKTALDLNLRVPDTQVRDTIASIPAVQKDGRFDMERYQQALKAQGLTPETFEQQVRSDLLLDMLPATLARSSMVPRSVVRRFAQLSLETRSVRLKRIPAAEMLSAVSVSEADIKEVYTSQSARFQTPEEADIAIVVFNKPESAERAELFTNLVYEQSDTLEPAARRLGLTIHNVASVRRDGTASKVSPEVGAALRNGRLLTAIFSADTVANKRNTEAIEIAPGLLASARIVNHRPPAPLALDKVSAQIERELRARKAAERATQQAEEAVRKHAASKELPAGLATARRVQRADLDRQGGDLPPQVLRAVLSAQVGSLPLAVSVPAQSSGDAWFALIESAEVPAADAPAVSERLAQLAQILERAAAQDTLQQWIDARRESLGVTVYSDKLNKPDNR